MSDSKYYIPNGTYWPFIGSIGLTLMLVGFANQMHDNSWGLILMMLGAAILIFMLFGWFGRVVEESTSGFYNDQVSRSFRWGMSWFIFSEVMFFLAFFGALFYARVLSVPWLGGASNNIYTPELWEGFKAAWPLIYTPGNIAQSGIEFSKGFKLVNTWGIPALNTLILLLSGVTLTIAHYRLKKGNRNGLIGWLVVTIILGVLFLGLQISEYSHAYEIGLKLTSGIYGSTFYMLTGFHGFHVTLGAIMLTVILFRAQKGHFSHDDHFAFEGVAWYWHFVDVVWLGLFIFVYWL